MGARPAIEDGAANEYRRAEFLISTDRERLNLDVVHGFLTNSYWAKGISREVVERSIEHSLCFGIYEESSPLASRGIPRCRICDAGFF